MLSRTIINAVKKYEKRGKRKTVINDGGQTVVVFTITEINFVGVDLFYDLARFLSYLLYICGIKCFDCANCLVLA